MAFETGETFSPSIRNSIGATGLIQFLKSTAIGLGTTTDALARETAIQQLAEVRRYFEPYDAKVHTLSDLYMAVLAPHYIGAAEDAVIFQGPAGLAYLQNRGLDANADGKVTKAEAASRVLAKLHKGNQPGFVGTYEWGA
jgi:hypothetical protein